MSSLARFLFVLITAAVVENAMFARALDTSRLANTPRTFRPILLYTGAAAALGTSSAVLIWGVRQLPFLESLRVFYWPPVYLLCLSAVYVAACLILKNWRPEAFAALEGVLAGGAYSGALLGVLIVAGNEHPALPDLIAYTLGGALGLGVARLLVLSARERLRFSAIPRVFAGLPIMLVYIGILSLAIYGLIGHPLAA